MNKGRKIRIAVHTVTDNSPWRQRFEYIFSALRERITLMDYPPGSRLDVDEISEEFDVSRTPVRNVLQRLDTDGLVMTRHGVGTIVTPLDFVQMKQAVLFRIELATLIGGFAKPVIDEDITQELGNVVTVYQSLLGDVDRAAFARVDIRAHKVLCRIIENEPLFKMYDELYFKTARLWTHFLPHQNWENEVSAYLKYFEMLYSAALNNDAMGIGLIHRNALNDSYSRLAPLLGQESV